jgi:Na+-driven multidrug efflux pump
MGTNIIAARSVMETVESLAFTLLIAISNASAILIGKELGASLFERAIQTARRLLILNVSIAILMGVFIFFIREPILIFFNVSEEVKILIKQVLLITAFFIPVKTINLMNIVGILRAGGDTKYSFFVEVGTLWGFGIPIAFITGLILKFPFPIVYLFSLGEECIKAVIMLRRYKSKKWAKNVVDNI